MSNFVYIHLFPNGKRYVGATQQRKPEYRWWKNGYGYRKQSLVYQEIQKYGWENIEHIVYEVETVEEMYYLEKYLIAYYDTTNTEKGYNKSIGGKKGAKGCVRSDEYKEKLSKTKKEQHIITPGAWKKGHEPWNKGLTYSGSPHNEEWRRHQSEGLKGKPKSEAHKQKMRKPREKQKWLTPEGEIREMNISHVKQHHPDWTRIE